METFDIIIHNKAKFELNKLIIDETITLDEWKSLGQSLRQVEGSVQFWIGDWARFGEKQGFTGKYVSPKVYDELEEITGLNRQTIQQYKSTATMLDSNLRNDNLSFTHHRAVAPLPTEQQKEFLQKASDEIREDESLLRSNDVTFKHHEKIDSSSRAEDVRLRQRNSDGL